MKRYCDSLLFNKHRFIETLKKKKEEEEYIETKTSLKDERKRYRKKKGEKPRIQIVNLFNDWFYEQRVYILRLKSRKKERKKNVVGKFTSCLNA